MGLTELIIVVVSAVLGWQSWRICEREIMAFAIVVLCWTAVSTVASLGYIDVAGLVLALVYRTVLVGAPYLIATLGGRLRKRRR